MRAYWIAFLLLGTLAWGQAKPAQLPPRPPVGAPDDDDEGPQAAASQVAPDAPVLTIKGFCPDQASIATNKPDAAACQTVVTRAEFEKLANAISPTMKPRVRRELANAYPRLLVMAHDAQERGLDKSSRVAELQRFSRLQILSQEMVREIQQEAANLSDEVIADYYHSNSSTYERASFERILVPVRKQMDSSPKEKVSDDAAKAQQAEGEEAMKKEANELRARAAAGEDFTKLQQAAYDAAGIKTTATAPELKKIRRSNFPATHLSAFDLKEGEVSQVISDASGHYIYKLDSKELMPLDDVKAEIKSALQSRNVQEAMRKIQESFTTEMNTEFFGTASMPQEASKKPAQPVQSK
ncbi:MAG: peptidyl-prolyl cis-trans isomerase [Candidatus Sulfotelmatobacter sp.]